MLVISVPQDSLLSRQNSGPWTISLRPRPCGWSALDLDNRASTRYCQIAGREGDYSSQGGWRCAPHCNCHSQWSWLSSDVELSAHCKPGDTKRYRCSPRRYWLIVAIYLHPRRTTWRRKCGMVKTLSSNMCLPCSGKRSKTAGRFCCLVVANLQ